MSLSKSFTGDLKPCKLLKEARSSAILIYWESSCLLEQRCSQISRNAWTFQYWKDASNGRNREGNFFRKSENMLQYTVSKVVDSILDQAPKLRFVA